MVPSETVYIDMCMTTNTQHLLNIHGTDIKVSGCQVYEPLLNTCASNAIITTGFLYIILLTGGE